MNETLETLGIQWQMLLVQCHQLCHRAVRAVEICLQADFQQFWKRARPKSPKASPTPRKSRPNSPRPRPHRQKILADAGDLANKIIADARAAAARVSEVETQKAVTAAEQILIKAREAAAQERAATLAALKRKWAGSWCKPP